MEASTLIPSPSNLIMFGWESSLSTPYSLAKFFSSSLSLTFFGKENFESHFISALVVDGTDHLGESAASDLLGDLIFLAEGFVFTEHGVGDL